MGILDKILNPGNQPQSEKLESTGKQTNTWPPSYEVEVSQIIRSIRRGSHLASMIPSELDEQARDWCEIFFNIIPENRLRDSYVAAEQNQDRRQEDRNFPLRRREILDAWYRIKAAEPKVIKDECDFCEMYFQSPADYKPCPFHKKAADLVGR